MLLLERVQSGPRPRIGDSLDIVYARLMREDDFALSQVAGDALTEMKVVEYLSFFLLWYRADHELPVYCEPFGDIQTVFETLENIPQQPEWTDRTSTLLQTLSAAERISKESPYLIAAVATLKHPGGGPPALLFWCRHAFPQQLALATFRYHPRVAQS